MVIIVSKSKNSATYYVQKSFRNRGGKVSTKIVERPGSLDDLVARFGPDDPVAKAKEYAKELSEDSVCRSWSSAHSRLRALQDLPTRFRGWISWQ